MNKREKREREKAKSAAKFWDESGGCERDQELSNELIWKRGSAFTITLDEVTGKTKVTRVTCKTCGLPLIFERDHHELYHAVHYWESFTNKGEE